MNAFHRHRQTSAPPAFHRLDSSQKLLLSALRHWPQSAPPGPAVAEPLFRLFGLYYIEAALEAFETLVQVVAEGPLALPALLPPGSRRISCGEQAILSLISAFQTGETAIATRAAADLTGPENVRELLAAASVIGEALDARRVLIRRRDAAPLALMTVVGRG